MMKRSLGFVGKLTFLFLLLAGAGCRENIVPENIEKMIQECKGKMGQGVRIYRQQKMYDEIQAITNAAVRLACYRREWDVLLSVRCETYANAGSAFGECAEWLFVSVEVPHEDGVTNCETIDRWIGFFTWMRDHLKRQERLLQRIFPDNDTPKGRGRYWRELSTYREWSYYYFRYVNMFEKLFVTCRHGLRLPHFTPDDVDLFRRKLVSFFGRRMRTEAERRRFWKQVGSPGIGALTGGEDAPPDLFTKRNGLPDEIPAQPGEEDVENEVEIIEPDEKESRE